MLVLFVQVVVMSYSQTFVTPKERLMSKSPSYVSRLYDHISFIADSSKSSETRDYYKNQTLELFIEQGNSFKENDIVNSGVKVDLISAYSKNAKSIPLKDYLDGLESHRYRKGNIAAVKIYVIDVGDLKKVDDDTYLCTWCYVLSFKGVRDSQPIYSDIARVKVNFYVSTYGEENIEDFLIKFGDMLVVENP